MSTYRCPACGASIVEGAERCSFCAAEINWQEDRPVVATVDRAMLRVIIYIFIALLAAGAVLAAVMLVLVGN